jgi:hypothetical protein
MALVEGKGRCTTMYQDEGAKQFYIDELAVVVIITVVVVVVHDMGQAPIAVQVSKTDEINKQIIVDF